MRQKIYPLPIWIVFYVLLLLASPLRAERAVDHVDRYVGCPTALSITVVDGAALCAGKPIQLKALVPSTPFGNWYWTKDNQKVIGRDQYIVLDVDQPGVYSLGGDWESNPCFTAPKALTITLSAVSSQTITLSPASVTLCEGETTSLSAAAGTVTGYSWLHNGVVVPQSTDRATLAVNESGTYSLSGLAGTCVTVRNQPVVQVNPLPTVSIAPSRTALCAGETAQLDAQTDLDNSLRWLLNGAEASTARSLTANAAGTYSLTATRPGGCQRNTTYAFAPIVYPLPTFSLDPVPAAGLNPGTSASTAPDDPTFRYQWVPTDGVSDPTIARPLFNPVRPTAYTLTITSAAGCQYAAPLFVPVAHPLYFPTAFSPNDDGQNDTWVPINSDRYTDAELLIYARSGELILVAKAGQPIFDGRLNGAPLPNGTYAYCFRVPSQRAEWRGTLLLLR